MTILIQEPHISIWHDHANQWLYVNWTGDQNQATVQDGCLKMLELVKQIGVKKVLNDNREVTSSWSDAANWAGTVWFPEMAAAGVSCFAWIYSPFVFSRLSTDTSISYAKGKVPAIATFDSFEDALDWLQSRPAEK